MSSSFTKTPGWLDWHPSPSTPTFALPARHGRRALPRLRPRRRVPLRARAQVHARATRARSSSSRCATTSESAATSIVQATCHGADNRAMVDAVRAAGGRARGDRDRPTRTSARPSCASSTRPASGGCGSTSCKRLVDAAPTDELADDREADRAARLARRHLLRGRRPGRAGGLLRLPARPGGGGPHGPPRRDPGRSTARSSRRFLRFVERNDVWVKVSCPERLTVTGPPARRRRAQRLRRRRALRAARRGGVPGPGAVGHRLAPPQPDRPHARRRAPGRPRSAHRRHARAAPEAPGRQPDAAVLARRTPLTPSQRS